MCVLDDTNTWSLSRPGHESSVRSVQLIRRWVFLRGSGGEETFQGVCY